jgi:Domain of unknown function (DUF892)
MAKKEKMLEDLFHETLKDIYYAEKKILTALPKMAKAAQSEDLQAAFEKHDGRGLRSGKTLLHALRATAVNYQGDAR